MPSPDPPRTPAAKHIHPSAEGMWLDPCPACEPALPQHAPSGEPFRCDVCTAGGWRCDAGVVVTNLRAALDASRTAFVAQYKEIDALRAALAQRDQIEQELRQEVEYWRDACGIDHVQRVAKLQAELQQARAVVADMEAVSAVAIPRLGALNAVVEAARRVATAEPSAWAQLVLALDAFDTAARAQGEERS